MTDHKQDASNAVFIAGVAASENRVPLRHALARFKAGYQSHRQGKES